MSVHVKVAGAWQEIGVSGGNGVPWAKVSGGTVTTVNNADGSVDEVHTFTADGTLTVDEPGYARVLLVSGGGGETNTWPGGGGDVRDGIWTLPSGALPVVVGAGGVATNSQRHGTPSSIGALTTALGPSAAPYKVGAGSKPGDEFAGYVSDISGTATTYGAANATATPNTGNGAAGGNGATGVVIVRVQKSAPTVSGVVATGGTVTEYTGDGVNGVLGQKYRVHTFTADGVLDVTAPGIADVLVIAGGGGATYGEQAAGGGAGGVLPLPAFHIEGAIPIVVGTGGNGGGLNTMSGSGRESKFGKLLAFGGGRGGGWGGIAGGDGGSGGGGAYQGAAGRAVYGGVQGFDGAGGGNQGGGGASGPANGANGGPGYSSGISGVMVEYAKGGGGSSPGAAAATPGSGGNAGADPGTPGAAGVVIVRYEIA